MPSELRLPSLLRTSSIPVPWTQPARSWLSWGPSFGRMKILRWLVSSEATSCSSCSACWWSAELPPQEVSFPWTCFDMQSRPFYFGEVCSKKEHQVLQQKKNQASHYRAQHVLRAVCHKNGSSQREKESANLEEAGEPAGLWE